MCMIVLKSILRMYHQRTIATRRLYPFPQVVSFILYFGYLVRFPVLFYFPSPLLLSSALSSFIYVSFLSPLLLSSSPPSLNPDLFSPRSTSTGRWMRRVMTGTKQDASACPQRNQVAIQNSML